jgi:hypothetical protein
MADKVRKINGKAFAIVKSKKGKPIPVTGSGGHRLVRCRGSHIFQTFGSQMAIGDEVLSLTRRLRFTLLYFPVFIPVRR